MVGERELQSGMQHVAAGRDQVEAGIGGAHREEVVAYESGAQVVHELGGAGQQRPFVPLDYLGFTTLSPTPYWIAMVLMRIPVPPCPMLSKAGLRGWIGPSAHERGTAT